MPRLIGRLQSSSLFFKHKTQPFDSPASRLGLAFGAKPIHEWKWKEMARVRRKEDN
jgi:hypothetical protein